MIQGVKVNCEDDLPLMGHAYTYEPQGLPEDTCAKATERVPVDDVTDTPLSCFESATGTRACRID